MSLKNSSNSSSKKKRNTATHRPRLVQKQVIDTITEYVLEPNGMRVLVAHIPGSLTVTTSIVYMVGSRHEETGDTGLAHMLEHMLFKPTSGKGVKWKDLENKGAHLNATTWLDRTNYYFNLPNAYLGDMLAVEADRMRNVLLTDKEFLPERANVLSEYEIQNSTPSEVLAWNVLATAFQNHGYHHDTIGWRGDIEGYTTEQLKRFYDRHYWPSNATLIVAGDVSASELSSHVLTHFGDIATHTPYKGVTRIEPEQQGLRRVVLRRETPLRVMYIAYKAPAFTHPDWFPLHLGLSWLTHGETSPLYKALIDTQLATDVSASIFPTHDPYLAYMTMHGTAKTHYRDIEEAYVKALAKIRTRGISETELSLQKEALLSDEAKSRDGSRNVALTLTEYVAAGDWKLYGETFDRIAQITTDDVSRVLATYLTFERATIGTLEQP